MVELPDDAQGLPIRQRVMKYLAAVGPARTWSAMATRSISRGSRNVRRIRRLVRLHRHGRSNGSRPDRRPSMADRLAVLIFRVSDDTDDDVVDGVAAYLEAPPDWTFESGSVVTSEQAFKRLSFGMFS